MRPKKLKNKGSNGSFDPQVFLDTAGVARKVVEYRRNDSIYSQGDAAETVMYIQKGGVRFSVPSEEIQVPCPGGIPIA